MIKVEEKLQLKLTHFSVELMDCGVRNKIASIEELGVYILGLTALDEIKDDTIKAIFELVGIAKNFERRSIDR